MKYIISIVLALAVLSAIPFLFGKKAPNVTTEDVFNNLKVEESNNSNTKSEEDMFGQQSNNTSNHNNTNTNSNTQTSTQSSQATQSPTPTPTVTTPTPAVTTPTPAPVVTAPPPAPTPTPPSPVSISIAGFAFSPSAVTVKKGTTVTWTNDDNVPHTSVTSQSGGFDSGMLSKGGKFSFTFQTVGTYDYNCGFHPSMRGSVIVTN